MQTLINEIQSIPVFKVKEWSLKKEVCLEIPKFAREKFKTKNKIYKMKVQKTYCCLKLITMTFENDKPMISAAIWHWMHCHSALPYTAF